MAPVKLAPALLDAAAAAAAFAAAFAAAKPDSICPSSPDDDVKPSYNLSLSQNPVINIIVINKMVLSIMYIVADFMYSIRS